MPIKNPGQSRPCPICYQRQTRAATCFSCRQRPRTDGAPFMDADGYMRVFLPEHPKAKRANGNSVFEHVLVAERALGKFLPDRAVVHHHDGIRSHNTGANLVICEDAAYHNLIHARQRAFEACGNPDWRRCNMCHQWDDPENMFVGNQVTRHRSCYNEWNREARARRKVGL